MMNIVWERLLSSDVKQDTAQYFIPADPQKLPFWLPLNSAAIHSEGETGK
jgi:hypothetical protein